MKDVGADQDGGYEGIRFNGVYLYLSGKLVDMCLNTLVFTSDNCDATAACLVKRHSGVLGLAALVEACPYSVPMWLPDVVDELALHLHDPAPIQVT